MEFDRFHQFGTLLFQDAFVLSYSGYVTEDILEAVGTTPPYHIDDHHHIRPHACNCHLWRSILSALAIGTNHVGPAC